MLLHAINASTKSRKKYYHANMVLFEVTRKVAERDLSSATF